MEIAQSVYLQFFLQIHYPDQRNQTSSPDVGLQDTYVHEGGVHEAFWGAGGGSRDHIAESVIPRILTHIFLIVLLDDVCAWMSYFSFNTWMQKSQMISQALHDSSTSVWGCKFWYSEQAVFLLFYLPQEILLVQYC